MALKILVLGAGFGGLELATLLSEELGSDLELTLIDQHDSFYFGFSKFDVMFGHKSPEAIKMHYTLVQKPGVTFKQEKITAIDPVAKKVSTNKGVYEADFLVIALGADYDFSATPGFIEGGHEFYSLTGATRLRNALPDFIKGHVIVGVTSTPFKCPPAPTEGALLMHDYLVKRGIRDQCQISLIMPFGIPIPPSPDTSGALFRAFKERSITFIPDTTVTSLDPAIQMANLSDGRSLHYDLFLGIPKHHVPDVVKTSGLADSGWIEVDQNSFKTQWPQVYAIGDVNNVATAKAGVFAEGGARIAYQFILAEYENREHAHKNPGAGICYIEFGEGLVGKVDVEFFSGPKPAGVLTAPSLEVTGEKKEFASSREERWFGIATMNVQELTASLKKRPGEIFLMDLMPRSDYMQRHIPGAVNIPIEELEKRIDEIPKDVTVVVACNRGLKKSDHAIEKLRKSGIHALKVSGGTTAWYDLQPAMEKK